MKKFKHISLFCFFTAFLSGLAFAQVAKNTLLLNLGYYNDNNQLQYLKVVAKTKIKGKFQMVPGIHVKAYISSEQPENALGTATTDDKGRAVLFIPPAAKEIWNKSPKQHFLVMSDSSADYDRVVSEAEVTKARIQIDTAEGKQIIARFLELKDTAWLPVKGVEMKIAVRRMGGDLNVNETPSFTTDSLGNVSADFKLDGLPGDSAGNLVLIARVEDNDNYGNLSTEKTVSWGTPAKYTAVFNNRSLYARRGRSPYWLEFMAYGIILAVWGVLFYLIIQIRNLKRLGA